MRMCLSVVCVQETVNDGIASPKPKAWTLRHFDTMLNGAEYTLMTGASVDVQESNAFASNFSGLINSVVLSVSGILSASWISACLHKDASNKMLCLAS